MPLHPGTRLGSYEVLATLGAGSMGEVYRAIDTRLDRQVALKILPGPLALDPDRLARFQREARVLASLNHPNIAQIYGLEDSGEARALVLELVEGPTLADRIGHGPVSVGDALSLATQITEALEAAHAAGVIHRDLKPANIKVRKDGAVKVLDFGLAKVLEDSVSGDQAASPTRTATASHAGVVVGTAAYMSPEQAKGHSIDRRTDVWAFGCVLYEMVTGRAAFPGTGFVETIASVLHHEPTWNALPPSTPTEIRVLLRRCLQKDPKRRLHDIADARIEIEEAQHSPREGEPGAPGLPTRRRGLVGEAMMTLTALVAVGIGAWTLRPMPGAPEVRLEINTPLSRDPSLAISPDGLDVAFVARLAGQPHLWLRPLASAVARPLAGTERATRPFWSPDGRSIGFFADSRVKRFDIDTGSVSTLVALSDPLGLGGAWSDDGTILFSNTPGRPIFRLAASGGEPVAATRLESPQQRSHSSPQFLPDGRHFVFFVNGNPEARGVYIGQLDHDDTRRVLDADAPAVYASTGHLLFIRAAQLLAQRFDPDRLQLRGEPFVMAEAVTEDTRLSASAVGPIVYRTLPTDSGQRELLWVDRSGRETAKVVYPDTAALGPALSPDGRHVAVFRFVNGNMDIWSYEISRRTWDRLTVDASDDIYPLWSPDASRFIFASNRATGYLNLYAAGRDAGPDSEELLLMTPLVKFPMDWSRDGRFLLFDSLDPNQGWDIWALHLDESPTPFEVVQTDFNERLAQFSPDGQWIAYQSDKTGRLEIYLRPFPGPGGDLPVSTAGGAQPRWSPEGGELFYVAADDRLMAVPVRRAGQGVELGDPHALFTTTVGSSAVNTNRHQYAVSADGQSFVMNAAPDETGSSPIMVILNWDPPD